MVNEEESEGSARSAHRADVFRSVLAHSSLVIAVLSVSLYFLGFNFRQGYLSFWQLPADLFETPIHQVSMLGLAAGVSDLNTLLLEFTGQALFMTIVIGCAAAVLGWLTYALRERLKIRLGRWLRSQVEETQAVVERMNAFIRPIEITGRILTPMFVVAVLVVVIAYPAQHAGERGRQLARKQLAQLRSGPGPTITWECLSDVCIGARILCSTTHCAALDPDDPDGIVVIPIRSIKKMSGRIGQ